ncbi:aminotransferase class I/II-fold pyridoxal phosphate-dependent enzyme [Rhizobium leguminosarum]|uniref:DegT/DnrJ/EryC1/StrS aminotransferase family protein n=1 Tax=Rhizobium leguminosarum TaxID=384 RepID=UPI0013DAAF29|nr:DegT/DnrJ/EryC1/StrS family aminotransferase [Rhizobium leguminosarum]NEH49739.1 aminotransferase class I/II-fold pyridoxal phosphate-dependent enzyme [Rhizobium leguminosarum]
MPSKPNFQVPSAEPNGTRTLHRWPILTGENYRKVIACISSGELSGSGLEVINEFEKTVENWIGGGHVVSTNSGTTALMVALLTLGVGPEDVVLVPSYTWSATAFAATLIGAIPRFVDIDSDTYNLSTEAVAKAITPDVKAIIVVHMHGLSCEMDEITAIAREKGVPIIEDCAQAHGALYKKQYVGTLSDIGCFSMQKSKHFSAGDGGFLVTRNAALAQKARDICNFGLPTPKHNYHFEEGLREGYAVFRECEQIGGMFRLNPLSAALVIDQLEHLDQRIEWLQEAMKPLVAEAAQVPFLKITQPGSHQTHVWHKIRVGIDYGAVDHYGRSMADIRQGLRNTLARSGIPSTLWTAPILPLQKVFRPYAGTIDWTKTAGHLAIENSFIVFDEKYPLIAQDPSTMTALVSKLRQVWSDYFASLE